MAYPPPALMHDKQLRRHPGAKLLAVALWWPVSPEEREPRNWQAVETLAAKAGLTRSAAFRAKAVLLGMGWVVTVREAHPTTGALGKVLRLQWGPTTGTPPSHDRDIPPPGFTSPITGTSESHHRDSEVPSPAPIGKEGSLGEDREFFLSSPLAEPTTQESEQDDEQNKVSEDERDGAGQPDDTDQVGPRGGNSGGDRLDDRQDPGHRGGPGPYGSTGRRGTRGTRPASEPSPEAIAAAQYLYDAIQSHSSEFCAGMAPSRLTTKLTGWAKAIDVGIRNDGMTLEGCRLAIDAAHRSEDDFWRSNLLSGKALRKHYEKLKMRASKQATAKAEHPRMDYHAIADKLDQL